MSRRIPERARLSLLRTPIVLAAVAWIGLNPGTSDAQPQLSPRMFLPGDESIGPAAGDQHKPEIARGGDQYLAVWVDQRTDLNDMLDFGSGPFDALDSGSMWDIYATRLDAQGDVIDATPIPVARQMFNQNVPDVAWNGENWLVVWHGQAVADEFGNRRVNVYAARVSPDGVVLDDPPIGIDLAHTMDGSRNPIVGSDGTNWFVVWEDLDSAEGIRTLEGLRIAPDATILDPGGVDVRHADYNSAPTGWDIAFLDDRYLVTFNEGVYVYGQFVAQDLSLIGLPFRISPFGRTSGSADMATDGSQFFVVFSDYLPGARSIRAARVALDGSVTTNILASSSSGFGCYKPMVAFDGVNFIVTYERGLTQPVNLRGSIVSPAGGLLQSEILIGSGAPHSDYSALAALEGGGAVVIWQDDRNGGFGRRDIMGAKVEPTGAVGDSYYVSLSAPRQSQPDAVDTGTGHTIVFLSDRSTDIRILAQRVDRDGAALDAEPVEVFVGGPEVTNPAVAWDGSTHLVVWEEVTTNQIHGKRLAADLTILDSEPLALLAGNMPDVAASGGLFLVVASEEPTNHIRYPMAIRFDGSTGETIGSPLKLGGNWSIIPQVDGFGGGGWAVTWERHPTHDNPAAFVHGATVGLDGTFDSFSVSSGRQPDVAAAADLAILVFDTGIDGDPWIDLAFRRVSSSGTVVDGSDQTLASEFQRQRRGAPTWDGEQFVVEWVDNRNDGPFDQLRGDLYGGRVGLDGSVLDPGGFAVATDSIPETQAFTSGRDGVSLLGGSIFHDDAAFEAQRIGYRMQGSTDVASVGDDHTAELRGLQASPNPSAGWTRVSFQLPEASNGEVTVYDVRGARVRQLHHGTLPAGSSELQWDGRNRAGRNVAPGVYFVRATFGDEARTIKVLRR